MYKIDWKMLRASSDDPALIERVAVLGRKSNLFMLSKCLRAEDGRFYFLRSGRKGGGI